MINEQYKTLNKRTNSMHVTLKKCMSCDITYLNVGGARCILNEKRTKSCWNGKKNMQFYWKGQDGLENQPLRSILHGINISHTF